MSMRICQQVEESQVIATHTIVRGPRNRKKKIDLS